VRIGADRTDRTAASALSVLSILSALVLLPLSISAQQPAIVSGRVVRARVTDTAGVAGATVVLHQVGRTRQGPIDSTIAGSGGEFRFRFRADTGSVYLLSSGWSGIEYFSTPVHTDPAQPDTGLVLMVSDTSSVVRVTVQSRHIVVSKPGADGTRPTLEIVLLGNGGPDTRVAGDSSRPTWGARLPRRALNFQVGQGDVSADAVVFRNDSVLLFAPIAPGDKQVLYTYQLPAAPGTVRIPLDDSVAVVNVLLEEFDRTVTGGAIVRGDSQTIEGRSFRQWIGPAPAGTVLTIDYPGSSSRWILPTLVSLVALSLGIVALRTLLSRSERPVAAPATPILDRLAELDARYRHRRGEVSAEEWAGYESERDRLKDQLTRQLAGRKPKS
jgi:hypothetical protein